MVTTRFADLGLLLRTSAVSVSALALCALAFPVEAAAQDGRRGGGAEASQSSQAPRGDRGNRGWSGNRGNAGGGNWQNRAGTGRSPAQAAPRNRGQQVERHRQSSGRTWSRSGEPTRAARPVQNRETRAWSGRDASRTSADRSRDYRESQRTGNWRNSENRRSDNRAARNWRNNDDRRADNARDRDRNNRNDRNWNDRNSNNRNWSNTNRNDHWRDNRRADNRRDWNDSNRRWNRDWRHDQRYDWNRYRNSNRHVYRVGRYNAPYRNYVYRRVSIGFALSPLFYSNRYWINDPWQYRLPPVHGPYRWIRYYDDALLVDIYTGEVVDVIHSFFW